MDSKNLLESISSTLIVFCPQEGLEHIQQRRQKKTLSIAELMPVSLDDLALMMPSEQQLKPDPEPGSNERQMVRIWQCRKTACSKKFHSYSPYQVHVGDCDGTRLPTFRELPRHLKIELGPILIGRNEKEKASGSAGSAADSSLICQ